MGPTNPLTTALTYGTPLSHELLLEVHIELAGKVAPATPRQMEMLEEYEAAHAEKQHPANTPSAPVLMQGYVLQYSLIPRQIDFRPGAKGVQTVLLQLGILSYDHVGMKLNGIETTMEDSISPVRFEQLSDQGYHFFQTVIVPLTATSLRVAVRDSASGR